MKEKKAILFSLPLTIALSGCFYSHTWVGSETASTFVWKQSPQVIFFITLVLYIGIAFFLYTRSIDDIKARRLPAGYALLFVIPLLLAGFSLARAFFHSQISIDSQKISLQPGFGEFADTNKLQAAEIDWKSVDSYGCKSNQDMRTTEWSSGGPTSRSEIFRYVEIVANNGTRILLPLEERTQFSGVCGLGLFLDLAFGSVDYTVRDSEQYELLDTLAKYAPPSVIFSGDCPQAAAGK